MRKSKKPQPSNAESLERRNWGNVFNLLVQMVRHQQNQLQSFANQKKFLEDRLQMQNERWASDVKLYKDQISQVKMFLIFEEKKRLFESAKADLMMGSKHREASVLKWILDSTKDDLEDFKAGFEYLSHKSSKGEGQVTVLKDTDKRRKGTASSGSKSSCNTSEKEKCPGEINDELRQLKDECEKLASEKNSELLALLAEKNFVWNQFKIMETDYANKLRSKQDEVEKANEKISILISSMEQLQSDNNKKDGRVSELESKVADMEEEAKRLNKEISGLSVELESLRKFKNNQVKPVLNRCTAGTNDSGITESNRSRRNTTLNKEKEVCTPNEQPILSCFTAITNDSGIIKSNRSRRSTTLNKEKEVCTSDVHASTSTNFSEKGKRSLKRKESPVISSFETPKLFTSSFKVPKVFFTGNKSCLKSRRKLNVDVFSFKDSDNDQLPSGGLNKTRLK
ncbi:uncharacterized protein [Cicer arietinum]|uniref:Uncharacterized protein LOC101509540 isoform X2 n=1 Tax=Cicer arietinum TaxID=3827 RepID=A0A1S2XD92_CICAR|nr:uncharacterized protein LOC101509540 isoform X2 [Cicer arietinum]